MVFSGFSSMPSQGMGVERDSCYQAQQLLNGWNVHSISNYPHCVNDPHVRSNTHIGLASEKGL